MIFFKFCSSSRYIFWFLEYILHVLCKTVLRRRWDVWDIDDSRTECSAVPWFVEGNITGYRFTAFMIMLFIIELNKLVFLKQNDFIFPLMENEYIWSFITIEVWPEIIVFIMKSYTFRVQMCHFLEMKVYLLILEYRKSSLYWNRAKFSKAFHDHRSRACQIPQPITCSQIFLSPCMYYDFINQGLTVNQSASALNSHRVIYREFLCLADMQCNTDLWLNYFSSLSFWIQIQTDLAKSKAVFISVYRVSLWP